MVRRPGTAEGWPTTSCGDIVGTPMVVASCGVYPHAKECHRRRGIARHLLYDELFVVDGSRACSYDLFVVTRRMRVTAERTVETLMPKSAATASKASLD